MNFNTVLQLLDYFKDEVTCIAYLEQQRWGGNPTCPFCGTEKPYKTNRGYKCRNSACYKKFTVKVGTIYENSKIPLRTWFAAIHVCTAHKKGISSCQLARDLGITQKTAWFVLHRIREMLIEKAPNMLKDELQVDETYVGGKEANKHKSKRTKGVIGRNADVKAPVIGVYDENGKVKTKVVPFLSRLGVDRIITSNLKPGGMLVTDAYNIYQRMGKRYQHKVINHKNGEYVVAGFHTNGIENHWSQLKRGIYGIYHHVSVKHLQRYCDEFALRYNTRDIKDHERFDLVLKRSDRRLKYNQLIGIISKM